MMGVIILGLGLSRARVHEQASRESALIDLLQFMSKTTYKGFSRPSDQREKAKLGA